MIKKIQTTLALFSLSMISFAQMQAPTIGTPQWSLQHQHQDPNAKYQHYQPQSGNDTLHSVYMNTACGLNYVLVSQRLGQRFVPIGIAQPAPFNVMIPPCATILQAYLYTEALGVASSITANLTDPASVSTSYPMANIGNSVDVCWGMNGTHVWRSDVTASITGAGTYLLSGLPVTANYQNVGAVDCEGATLLIIYSDPSASYTGTLSIDDGCHTVVGGQLLHNMTGFNACANSSSANVFMMVGDMQMTGYTLSMNGNNVPQPQWDWWNEISTNTSVTNGQNSCTYSLNSVGDCYTLAVAGLYFQTACSTCIPVSTNMVVTTNAVADNCNGNGSASVNVTGGSGNYTYLWFPGGNTTANPTNLAGGTYTVYINDGTACTSATVVVPYTGMNLAMSSANVSCTGNGSATINVSGGQSPYTYAWSPSGGTNATATNLWAGNYTVIVTDNSGCSMTSTVTITNSGVVSGTMYMTPDMCNSSTGAGYVSPQGGIPPYSYLWNPGGQTTQNATGLSVGIYSVTITDNNGCTITLADTVVNSQLSIYAYGYNPYNCGDSAQFFVTCNDPNATYTWTPSTYLDNPNSDSPTSGTPVTMTYTVTVNSTCGTAVDSFTVVFSNTNYYVQEICFVTVDTVLNKNKVIWERWNSPTHGSFNIYRETTTPGVYAIIASQPIQQLSTFTDMSSNPSAGPDRYKISTVDTCGVESDTSYHHRTIFLTTTANGPGYDLNWNAYEGLPINTYYILRGSSSNNMTVIDSVAGNILTYNDPNPPVNQTLYQIEAVHPYGGCNPSKHSGPNTLLDDGGAYSNINNSSLNSISESEQLLNSFAISPNPGNGNFQLSIFLSNAQEFSLNVFDNIGQAVHKENGNGSAGNFKTTIDLSRLSAGVYFVQVQTKSGMATKKLVIE